LIVISRVAERQNEIRKKMTDLVSLVIFLLFRIKSVDQQPGAKCPVVEQILVNHPGCHFFFMVGKITG
jgi:hypothetical protein